MKIIFMTSAENRSGGARQAMFLAQGLQEMGHSVTMFVPEVSELPPLAPDFNWGYLPMKRRYWRHAVEEALPASGENAEPVVVQAFHNKAVKRLAWWSTLWRYVQGRKNIVAAGYRGVCYRPNNPLPYIAPGMDAYVANSKACASVLRTVGAPKRKLHVIYNGLPPGRLVPSTTREDFREQLGFSQDDFIFGSVTGNKRVKGVEPLLEAWGMAQPLNAKLILVGMKEHMWEPRLRELGIEDSVTLVSHTENIADYFQIFDGYVMPSLMESLPNVLLEAYESSLPVICNAVGGVPEVVDGNGILTKAKDRQSMAEALKRFVNEPESRERWATRTRELARYYTLQRKVEDYEKLYTSLLLKRGLLYK